MELFTYQRTGAQWLRGRPRGLLADSMGLGKTVQALAAFPVPPTPAIVVCPAAVKGVWEQEVRVWRPDLTPHVLSGTGSFRWPAPGELIVVNYDILPERVEPAPPGCILIADEAHYLKSGRAQRTKRFRALRRAVSRAEGRVWLLTGTPMPNSPPELWHVLYSAGLAEEAFGSYRRFQWLFNARRNRWGGTDYGEPRREVPELLRRVMLRRERRDVLPELPEKTYREHKVSIDRADVWELLEQAYEELEQVLAAQGIDLTEALEMAASVNLERALSIDLIAKARAALAAVKVPALLDLVEVFEEAREPLVVFSAHRAPVEALAARKGWAAITGSVPAAERTEAVRAFQAGELSGIAGTIQAAGVGLTLTHAHQAVFVDLSWTPADNQQAEDRVCRIGQTRGVVITRLVADHVLDQRVTRLLARKQQLIAGAVEAAARR